MKQDRSDRSQKTAVLTLASGLSALLLLALPVLADPFSYSTGNPDTNPSNDTLDATAVTDIFLKR